MVEREFNCLWENTETYKTFSVLMAKQGKRIDRNMKWVTISYKWKSIDSAKFTKWEAHYQVLLIILLKQIIKLNSKMDMTIKNEKCVVLSWILKH